MENRFLHNLKSSRETEVIKKPIIDQKFIKAANVDINRLLNRVKIEKNNKRNENLILLGGVISLISFVAIISF